MADDDDRANDMGASEASLADFKLTDLGIGLGDEGLKTHTLEAGTLKVGRHSDREVRVIIVDGHLKDHVYLVVQVLTQNALGGNAEGGTIDRPNKTSKPLRIHLKPGGKPSGKALDRAVALDIPSRLGEHDGIFVRYEIRAADNKTVLDHGSFILKGSDWAAEQERISEAEKRAAAQRVRDW
jgi:hypothetical protein